MTSASRHRLVVGAALVDDLARPSRLLAARRYATTAAGLWEFPGGKVEPGEEPAHALQRELREELNLNVSLGEEVRGPLEDGSWPITEGWRIRVWLARPEVMDISCGPAHDELRWLGPQELTSVRWLPADVDIVAALSARMVR